MTTDTAIKQLKTELPVRAEFDTMIRVQNWIACNPDKAPFIVIVEKLR